MDFATGISQAERQRKIAEMLRQKGMEAGPQGQMVSGHYVAPSIFAQLTPLANQLAGQYAGGKADELEKASKDQITKARDQWASSLPQAVAAKEQQTQQYMAPGMEGEEAIPGLQTITQQAQPAQPVTTGQVLKHTLAGMEIPGNEKAAGVYNTGALAEITREDTQKAAADAAAARAAEVKYNAAAKAQSDAERQRERIEAQIQLAGNNEALRRDLQSQSLALQRQIAEMSDATRRYGIEMGRDAARERAEAAKAKESNKPVSTTVMKELGGLENNATGITDMAAKYKPDYGGFSGAVDNVSGTWNPLAGAKSKEAANWWKDYENQAALVERHEKFGTALSAGEQAAWKNATISPGMNKDTIDHNLKERARIANDLFNRTRDSYIKAGHTGVEAAFEKRPGSAPAAPPTKSIGGKTYVQKDGQWYEQ
jgi:hypothetical protein